MYLDFKRTGQNDLFTFFQKRIPEITDEHLTCVGLSLELRKQIESLEDKFPQITEHLYMVSSEENVDNLTEYMDMSDGLQRWTHKVEKEHVLMALKFQIGERYGILLCDPGYHVARVIVIMEDGSYPHTGRFVQSDEDNVRKEYEYTFNEQNPNFINWTDIETRGGQQRAHTSLVYIERPYLTAVDLTERRNFVYDFRSWLARDMKGHLTAGIYFPVKKGRKDFTLFYEEDGRKEKFKFNFDDFLNPKQLDEKTLNIVSKCSEKFRLPINGHLLHYINSLALLINDDDYVDQLLTINAEINEMT